MNTAIKNALEAANIRTGDAGDLPTDAPVHARVVHLNPLDIFAATMGLMDIRSKAISARTLIGVMNSSMVGYASRIVNKQQRDSRVDARKGYSETGEQTIDRFNALIAAEELKASQDDDPELAAPVGLAPSADPRDIIQALAYLRSELQDSLNFGDEMWAELCDLKGTLDFMCAPRPLIEQRVKTAATLIKVDIESVRKMMQLDAEQDAAEMSSNRERIVEILEETCNDLGFFTFEDLPAAVQVKMVAKIDNIIARQKQFAWNGVKRGTFNADSDYALLDGGQRQLAAWLARAESCDPEYAAADNAA